MRRFCPHLTMGGGRMGIRIGKVCRRCDAVGRRFLIDSVGARPVERRVIEKSGQIVGWGVSAELKVKKLETQIPGTWSDWPVFSCLGFMMRVRMGISG